MIRVGFDISQLAHNGGVSTYTVNLAEQLSSNPDLEMAFFYSSLRKSYKGKLKGVKKFKLPPTLFEMLFNKLRNIPIEHFLGPLDIFHSSDWVQPPSKAKKVTTYHDVIPLKYPEWSHPKIVEVHKRRLKLVEQEVDLVIAVSETTKKDLLEISDIPSEKIVVIYEGVDKRFKPLPEKDIEDFKDKYKLPDKFMLAIGGIGERRNMKRVKEVSKGYNLIITGETIPWINDDELPYLYNAAAILLYPSLYEGFGLPILESMASGTPVITSNIGSMEEVSGGCALLVNPKDIEDISEKIDNLMNDQKLYESLKNKGINHSGKFTWEKCADKTAEVYRELAV
jgi:glycosyltransferase involved in cell wall biosynthesis